MRFIKYVVDAGGRVVLPAIDAPQARFKTAEAAIKLSLDQEVKVTHQINALVELARSENDYITINFLFSGSSLNSWRRCRRWIIF